MLRVGSVPSSPHNSVVLETKAHLGLNLGLGSTSLGLGYGLHSLRNTFGLIYGLCPF